jgi:hypothetical protein
MEVKESVEGKLGSQSIEDRHEENRSIENDRDKTEKEPRWSVVWRSEGRCHRTTGDPKVWPVLNLCCSLEQLVPFLRYMELASISDIS